MLKQTSYVKIYNKKVDQHFNTLSTTTSLYGTRNTDLQEFLCMEFLCMGTTWQGN